MKCITLEYPDGSIGTRGGLGTCSLARFCLAAQTGEDPAQVEQPNRKVAEPFLASLSPAEIEAGRDLGLQFILDVLVPVDNPGLVARIEDIEFPADKVFRSAWQRGAGKIDINLPKARAIQAERIVEAQDKTLKDLDALRRRALIEGRAPDANKHASDRAAIEALNLGALSAAIQNAATSAALDAVWPAGLPRP